MPCGASTSQIIGISSGGCAWNFRRMLRSGHADQNITLSIYSHAMPVDDRAAEKVWDDALGDVIESSKKPEPCKTTAHYCAEEAQKEVFAERKTG
jgi:hypothetical protein